VLGAETGLRFDAFIRYTDERLRAELAAFHNQLDGYIFPSSRGRAETAESGDVPRFQYTNEDARFIGAEGSIEWNVAPRVVVDVVGSLVHAKFTSTRAAIPVLEDGDTTFVTAATHPPLIPPANGHVGIRYETPGWFAGAATRLAARQDRTGDFETPTDGYAVLDFTAGVRILHDGRMHSITLGVDNALDTEYRDHMSRIKELMPQPGASMSLLYRLAF
jgi:iron complex outermembrane receptor protein